MNSNHPREMLSAYLDGELTGEETAVIEEHLETCEECRDILETWRANDKLITGIDTPDFAEKPPVKIAEIAINSQKAARPAIKAQSRTVQFVAFAMAAAAALMLFFRAPWNYSPDPGPKVKTTKTPLSKSSGSSVGDYDNKNLFANNPYYVISVDQSNTVSVMASAPVINTIDMLGNLNVGLNVEPVLNQYEVILLRTVTADENTGQELLNIQNAVKNTDLLEKTRVARAYTVSAPDYDKHLQQMEMLLTRIQNVDESTAKSEAPAIQQAINGNELLMRNGQLRNALREYNEKVIESQSK